MKVLIVNYYYPPLIDAHAYRWEQIAQYWVSEGHNVEIITGSVLGAPARQLEQGVIITRVGLIKRPVQTSTSTDARGMHSDRILRKIMNTIRPLYRKLYWPDSAWHWIPSLMLEMFRRRSDEYDLVVSYYPCMGAHLSVAALKYFSKNSKFKWICDYGDPFSTSPTMQPNNYKVFDLLNKWTERRLARVADFMVFTNKTTLVANKAVLGDLVNLCVIPHLVNIKSLYSDRYRQDGDRIDQIVLHYIGGFHKKIREPGRLFELVAKLNNVERGKYLLKIYGPLNGFNQEELSPKDCPEIIYLGSVERDKAIEILKAADFIVNVDNENCIMTPSKAIECISTGRPMINITNNRCAYQPLKAYENTGFLYSLTDEKISDEQVAAVKSFIKKHSRTKSAPIHIVRELVKKHLLETVANQYLELFKNPK